MSTEAEAPAIPRLFIVGTDTDCGKTQVTCALLRSANRAGLDVLPFKPAVSGRPGPRSDHARLAEAAKPAYNLAPAAIAPLRYAEPVAPGVADELTAFTSEDPEDPDRGPMEQAVRALEALEREHKPDLTLIEGAGGVFVPMPGRTWLPDWIEAFTYDVVVVGRLGLGTINHTLLTIDALRMLDLAPRGFFLSQTTPREDASCEDNARIIECARRIPCLGVLPHTPPGGTPPDDWHFSELWRLLLEELSAPADDDEFDDDDGDNDST